MEWRPVKGFEDKYLISDAGSVYGIKRGHILKTQTDSKGYKRVMLSVAQNKMKYKWVHRLVAESFCKGYKVGYEVNHIDFNRSNNNYTNLEWVSHHTNVKHSVAHNRWKAPPKNFGNFLKNSY